MRRLAWISACLLAVALFGGPQASPPLFSRAPGSPFAVGTRPANVAVGDVNGDGTLDILTANFGSNDINILVGNGRGSFRPGARIPFPGEAPPHLIAVSDVSGDAKLDVVLTSHDSNDVVVLLGNGKGGFAPAPGSPFAALRGTPPHNHGLAVADVNGDAALDI